MSAEKGLCPQGSACPLATGSHQHSFGRAVTPGEAQDCSVKSTCHKKATRCDSIDEKCPEQANPEMWKLIVVGRG